jgi:hypothetical protein
MTCARHADALSDVAAGDPAAAELEAHLASCAACRAELAALRQALAVADDELSRLLLAEPSRDLAARIRTAVAESTEAAPGRRPGWSVIAAAAAATVVVATIFVADLGPRPEPRATVVDRAPAHETTRATPAPETVAPSVAPFQPVESRRRASLAARTQPAREPEVLVQKEEAEALVRLAAHLRRRSVTPESLLVADLSVPLAEPNGGEIQPIEIVPLDPAESSGAERKGDHS